MNNVFNYFNLLSALFLLILFYLIPLYRFNKAKSQYFWLGIICDAKSIVVTQYYKTGSELSAFAFNRLSFTLSQGALC